MTDEPSSANSNVLTTGASLAIPAKQGFFRRAWARVRGPASVPRSDRQQLLHRLREAQHHDVIDDDALAMIEGAMQMAQLQVRDIMIPRAQMMVLERDGELTELLDTIVESGHSRFPLIGENRDDVLGLVLAKDLLRVWQQEQDTERRSLGSEVLRELLRPAFFVPQSKRLNVLLREFRNNRNHLAIVIDEYGGVAGLVTIEDVLEQIVGEIDDEHDVADDAHNILQHDLHSYTVKALTPIAELNEKVAENWPDDEVDTVAGLVMTAAARMPANGDKIPIDGWVFEVLRADNRRVHLLRLTRG